MGQVGRHNREASKGCKGARDRERERERERERGGGGERERERERGEREREREREKGGGARQRGRERHAIIISFSICINSNMWKTYLSVHNMMTFNNFLQMYVGKGCVLLAVLHVLACILLPIE